jgi:predicted acylesterase/phospholipase RssA
MAQDQEPVAATVSGAKATAAPSTQRQHAVVFSGNGYNAAYEVGVLKALLEGVSPATKIKDANQNEKIEPRIYTGTSVGAYNAAFMVSHSELGDLAAAEKLEQSWRTRLNPRLRGNPFDYLDPRTYWPNPLAPVADFYNDTVHLSRDLMKRAGDFFGSFQLTRPLAAFQDQILDYEWDILADLAPTSGFVRDNIVPENIRNSKKELRITAANWKKGATTTFQKRDFSDAAGHSIIIGAMAVPGFTPRQRVDLEEYLDGTMLMEYPLQPAIEARDRQAGARLTLHVIYLDPEFEEGLLMDARGSLAIVYRLFLLAFSRSVNADIKRIDQMNRSLKFLELLRDFDPESEVMKLWRRLHQETTGAVEVEVHRYRSAKHLTSISEIFVGMTEARLKRLFEAGYRDARQHDCKASHCVLISEE